MIERRSRIGVDSNPITPRIQQHQRSQPPSQSSTPKSSLGGNFLRFLFGLSVLVILIICDEAGFLNNLKNAPKMIDQQVNHLPVANRAHSKAQNTEMPNRRSEEEFDKLWEPTNYDKNTVVKMMQENKGKSKERVKGSVVADIKRLQGKDGGAKELEKVVTTDSEKDSSPIEPYTDSGKICQWGKHIFENGTWTFDKEGHHPYKALADYMGRDDNCDNSWLEGGTYRWKPKGCNLHHLTRKAFCEALDGRSLIFVGDSLLFQTALGAYYVLNGSIPNFARECETTMPRATPVQCPEFYACDGRVKIGWVRNDFLTLGGVFDDIYLNDSLPVCHIGDCPWDNIRPPWPYRVMKGDHIFMWHKKILEYDIAFLSTSGHWTGARLKGSDPLDYFRRHIWQVASYLKDSYKGLVVWKGQTIGHEDCQKHTKPLTKLPDKIGGNMQWNWDNFPKMHSIGETAFSCKIPNEKLITFDPSILAYRIDRHTKHECLHYCIPGPSDVWNQLLVNALLSKEHASAAKPDEKDCPPDPPHIGMFNMIKGNKPMTWYKIKA